MARRYSARQTRRPPARNRLLQRPTPPAPPPPYVSPQPQADPGYQQRLAFSAGQRPGVYAQLGNPAIAPGQGTFAQRYGTRGESLARQYGFEAGYQTDPYSLAKQLEKSYQESRAVTSGGYAGRGQLYSTAYEAAQKENEGRYSQGAAELQGQYQKGLQSITDQATEALSALDQGDLDAYQSALDRIAGTEPPPVQPPDTKGYGRQLARYFVRSGTAMHGPQWREVIDALGYDPRKRGKRGLRFRG
jgi:soluble cytochrome b562